MKIFITGVAGFLGSHLADLMLSQGHKGEHAGAGRLLRGTAAAAVRVGGAAKHMLGSPALPLDTRRHPTQDAQRGRVRSNGAAAALRQRGAPLQLRADDHERRQATRHSLMMVARMTSQRVGWALHIVRMSS